MAEKGRNRASAMRLDKFLAEMGQGSRSQVKELIQKGHVQVNGQVVKSSELKVKPEFDRICLDGEAVAYAGMEYYMLNKPQGVVSATEDERYTTVVQLIDTALRKDLFPVGRLDIDTEGLLLITNDGALTHRLLSPKKHVDKVYRVRFQGEMPSDAQRKFKEGMYLEDGTRTLPAHLRILGRYEAEVTLHEGKFHQVKRMFQALGCQVVYLKRLSMGPLTLDENLAPGQYRPLSETELQALKKGELGKQTNPEKTHDSQSS